MAQVGILDFYHIQISQRNNGIKPIKSTLLKNKTRGLTLLVKAIKELGHRPILYSPEQCQLFFDGKEVVILQNGKKTKKCDVLIPRINVTQNVDIELSLIKQFELMGVPLLNNYLPILKSLNKIRSLQYLANSGVPIPKTVLVRRITDIDTAVDMIGGYPFIVKLPYGTHGKGVLLIESRRALYSTLDVVWKYHFHTAILFQEYFPETEGSDYRAFVVEDRVVASMKRNSKAGDFRSNLHLGGSAESVKLTQEEQEMAVKATKILGLHSCGVDLLRTKKGPLVMEMNPCGGIVGISTATGVNVAAEIVKYALKLAKK